MTSSSSPPSQPPLQSKGGDDDSLQEQGKYNTKLQKTEVGRGIENITKKSQDILSSAKIGADYCYDSKSSSILAQQFLDVIIELNRKGIRQRFITDITDENIKHSKEVAKYVELRHMDAIKGNFVIVDRREYGASTNIDQKYDQQSSAEFIYSNVKGFIEHQQNLFETLWNKSISAEQRIREIEEEMPPNTTEIWHGLDYIEKKSTEQLSKAKECVDYCHDSRSPSASIRTEKYLQWLVSLKERGVRVRFITEITKENIRYSKELAKYVELRHFDEIKGNFAIIDRKVYGASANIYELQPYAQFICSTVKPFVDQQQAFLDMLWNKSIPAKQRFKELEHGAKREFVETIRDPAEIQQLGFDLIRKADDEILILFSTTNAFLRQEKAGALNLLKEAASPPHDVKIRILIPEDRDNKDNNNNNNSRTTELAAIKTAEKIIEQLKELGIDVRRTGPQYPHHRQNPLQNKITLLIVDQSLCLTVELNDDTKENSEEAIGLATYSNSDPTVFAYTSIFENLWMRT